MRSKHKNSNIKDEANNSSIEFVHLILIPIGNNQTPSTCFFALYASLWLLNDVNIRSANGIVISKASNKYQVNSVTGLSKQMGQVAQSSNWVLKLTFHKILF